MESYQTKLDPFTQNRSQWIKDMTNCCRVVVVVGFNNKPIDLISSAWPHFICVFMGHAFSGNGTYEPANQNNSTNTHLVRETHTFII